MTTTTIPSAPPLAPAPSLTLRKFTVAEYHRMIAGGVLGEEDAVELLEGWVVHKMPHNPPHDIALGLTDVAVRVRLRPGWHVRIQMPITTGDSEPEPDLVIAVGVIRDYANAAPAPHQLGLVVEVSDATLTRDRDVKGRLYARAGVCCYWIINLVERRVEVYSRPSGPAAAPGFLQSRSFGPTEAVPLALAGHALPPVPVADLLP